MKKILIILLFNFFYLDCAESKEIFTARPFIVIFDDTNETLPQFLNYQNPMFAMTLDLMSAIIDKVSPILVTKTLMFNFLGLKKIFHDFVSLDDKNLKLKYQKYELFKKINIENFQTKSKEALTTYEANKANIIINMEPDLGKKDPYIDKAFAAYITPFFSKDWIVKELNQDFYLLIPRSYFDRYVLSYKGDVKVTNNNLLKEEFEAGFKFQHFNTVSSDFFNIPETFFSQMSYNDPFYNPQEKFLSTLKSLFIPVIEYKNAKEEKINLNGKDKSKALSIVKIPQWNIFFGGHGSRSKANLAAIEENLIAKRQELEKLKQQILAEYINSEKKKYKDPKKAVYIPKNECISYLNQLQESIYSLPPTCTDPKFEAARKLATQISSDRVGSLGYLAGLRIPYFTQALLFFNDLQAMALICVFSCFAAGENLRVPYLQFGKDILLNYTVISLAITEETTSALGNGNFIAYKVNGKKYKLTPAFEPFFDILLKRGRWVDDAKRKRSYTFIDAVPYAAGFYNRNTGDFEAPSTGKTYLNNLAWIRPAGASWFSFAAYRKKTFIIDRMMSEKVALEEKKSKLKKTKKTLIIRNKELILLNISDINFPLSIEKSNDNLPQILSIMPGSATHRFEEKVSVQGDFKEYLNSILRQDKKTDLPSYAFPPPKYFYFKNLECNWGKNKSIYNDVLVLKYKLTSGNRIKNEIYAFNTELKQRTYLEWYVSEFTLDDVINNFAIIDVNKWNEGMNEFTKLEKDVKAKFSILFKRYDFLTKAFESTSKGGQLAMERVAALKKYEELLKKNKIDAQQWLEMQPKEQQMGIKSMILFNTQSNKQNMEKLFSLNLHLNNLSNKKILNK